MNLTDLPGSVVDFVYADETYRIEIVTSDQLRWTRTRGDEVGLTDIERFVASDLDGGRVLITWIEATGLGLSSVIDVEAGTLLTHANSGREVFVNHGRTELVSGF